MPILKHPFCKDPYCPWCLSDHEVLADYIKRETGVADMDHLQRYRLFLEKRHPGVEFETEWGWAHPDVFKDENVAEFIRHVRASHA